jgi:hypothetical protein
MLYVQSLLKYMRKNGGLYSRLGVVLLEAIAHRTSRPCAHGGSITGVPQRSANRLAAVAPLLIQQCKLIALVPSAHNAQCPLR